MKLMLLALCVLPIFAQAQTDTTGVETDTTVIVTVQPTAQPAPLDDERSVSMLDETTIFYSGAVNGNYASGNVSRLLVSTSHNINVGYRSLSVPVLGTFSYGEQNDLLKERE